MMVTESSPASGDLAPVATATVADGKADCDSGSGEDDHADDGEDPAANVEAAPCRCFR